MSIINGAPIERKELKPQHPSCSLTRPSGTFCSRTDRPRHAPIRALASATGMDLLLRTIYRLREIGESAGPEGVTVGAGAYPWPSRPGIWDTRSRVPTWRIRRHRGELASVPYLGQCYLPLGATFRVLRGLLFRLIPGPGRARSSHSSVRAGAPSTCRVTRLSLCRG